MNIRCQLKEQQITDCEYTKTAVATHAQGWSLIYLEYEAHHDPRGPAHTINARYVVEGLELSR